MSIDLDGGVRTRLDFVGELRGELYLYEAKNGIAAGLTTNQKINMPKMLMDKPVFTPSGKNAFKVKFPGFTVGKPYTGPYIVVYKHYF